MSSFTYGTISVQPTVPEDLLSYVIPDFEPAVAQGDYGSILLQEVQTANISILYTVMKLKEDLALDFQCTPGNLQTHVALKDDSHFYIRGIGDMYLSEGQYNILDAPELEGTFFLEKDHEYRTLHISFSAPYLEKLLPVFQYLSEWLATETERPRLLYKVHAWLSTQLKDVTDRLLNSKYENASSLYRGIKAEEFLFLALVPGTKEITPVSNLNRRTVSLVYELKHILDNSYDQHITVPGIAIQLGINEFKLRAGFKQVFGISIFDYVIKLRMHAARELLLDTDKPIKEIAALTGYATKQSFLNAFKRYFRDTPGSFRKT